MNDTLLTKDTLRTIVPAAFAAEPSDRVSDKYSFISTERIVDELMDRGWMPASGTQSRKGDVLHGTHTVHFRRPNTEVRVGGVLPEIILSNNHMAIRAARLLAGFLKLVCSNGLMVSTGIGETQAVTVHRGDASIEVDMALNDAVLKLDGALEQIAGWQSIQLSPGERLDFANRAGMLRNHGQPVNDANALLERRRVQDQDNDLWTVFNAVQENIIKGGVYSMSNRRRTRGIRAVTENERINTSLWELAEVFATQVRDGQSAN